MKLASFLGWEQVGDGHEARGHDDPASDALDGAERDKLGHRLAQAGRNRTHHEDGDTQQEEDPAPVEVGEPAHDRDRDRGCHQVGGRSPRVAVESAQVGDDAGHCGGDDGLAERGQEHRQHQPGQRQEELSSRKRDEIASDRLVGSGFGIGADVHVHLLPLCSFRRKFPFTETSIIAEIRSRHIIWMKR